MKTKVTILGTESKESKKLKPIEAKYCVQNTQITGGVLNVTTGPFDLTPKREIKVIMIEGYGPFDCLIIDSSDNLFLGHFNDGVVE